MDNLRRFFTGFTVSIILLLLGAAAGCTSTTGPSSSVPAAAVGLVEKVEVYHFHGNQQCASCIAVGDLAEMTVNENFRNELASGRLVFAHINAQEPENAELAEKYGVTGSSLWIGVYDANGFHKEQDIKVWSLTSNKEMYKMYLSAVILKRLNGDFS